MRSRLFTKRKLNNSGAALVTVIIIIAFLSVLVTTILYMAGVNYFMKSADRQTKESFYEAEIGMERIRAELMIEANEAFQVAYKETMQNFLNEAGAGREAIMNTAYTDALKTSFDAKLSSRTLEDYLKSMVPTELKPGLTVGSTAIDYSESSDGRVYIRDVKIVYTRDTYTTMIETDFMIKLPDMDLITSDSEEHFPVGEDVSSALSREVYNMADCVTYNNWKKE